MIDRDEVIASGVWVNTLDVYNTDCHLAYIFDYFLILCFIPFCWMIVILLAGSGLAHKRIQVPICPVSCLLSWIQQAV